MLVRKKLKFKIITAGIGISLFFVYFALIIPLTQAQVEMGLFSQLGSDASIEDIQALGGQYGQSISVDDAQNIKAQLKGNVAVKQQSWLTKALDTLNKGLAKAGSVAFQSGLTTMLNTLAYDAANYVASGLTGQQAAFETRSLGDVFKDSLDAGAGEFLHTLGAQGFGGINLCQPSLGVGVKIGLGLVQYQKPQPACTFSQMRNNWEAQLRSPTFLRDFQDYFEPTSNDLGIALSTQTDFLQSTVQKANSALEEVKMNKGWLDIRNFAGVKETPADLVSESVKKDLIKQPENIVKFTGNALIDAANIFLNQLAIQLIRNLLYGGLYKGGGVSVATGGIYNPTADVSSGGGVRAAEERFRQIVQPRFNIRGDYNILSELVQCPDPNKAGPTNCVITERFRQAVQDKKTVGQAMREGTLNPAGAFGFSAENQEPRYTDENYPYRSLIILRKFRILPVGWEVAARYINEHFGDEITVTGGSKEDIRQTTLAELVNCFSGTDDYGPREVNNNSVETSRWCRNLVDPNWVLKAPLNYCARSGYGPETFGEPQVVSGQYTISRKDNYCADEQACVKENADGSCEVYGYCTQERRTWNFGANACNPLYNTCQTFTQAGGASVSYLQNTLQWCDSNSAGCTAYSTNYNYQNNTWSDTPQIYLNRNAGSCNAQNEGCHEFLRISKNRVESLISSSELPASGSDVDDNYYNSVISTTTLKLLPSYLVNSGTFVGFCYDAEGQLKADAPALCNNFVRQCTQAEVGCESFTRARDGFVIPAKVGSNDYCPQACNGYDIYIQQPTVFESVKDQYLIPASGRSCSAQAVGCDQFTNLDEVAQGGEGIEYYSVLRQCTTESNASRPYYTWEGSDESGFQLKVFTLKKSGDENIPAVTEGGIDTTNNNNIHKIESRTVCDQGIFNAPSGNPEYNPDCRQFYSRTGVITYALFTRTISYDTNCHPYRRSSADPVADLVAANNNTNQTACTNAGGRWNTNSTCSICKGGGEWRTDINACIYMAIPQQGVMCSAPETGCRKYVGNIGNNVRIALADDFENGNISGWRVSGNASIVSSNQSVRRGGRSLEVSKDISKDGAAFIVKQFTGGTQGKSYTVELLVKKSDSASALHFSAIKITNPEKERANTLSPQIFQISPTNPNAAFLINSDDNEWKLITFYLPSFNRPADSGDELQIITAADSPGYYLDSVVLREVVDNYYLIKDSWNTSCQYRDLNPQNNSAGNYDPSFNRGVAGCYEYRDRAQASYYLKSFSALCSESAIGCELMIDTQNYTPTGERTGNPLVSADKFIYAVYDAAKNCTKENKGCQRLGKPNTYGDRVISHTDTYLLNNPDDYQRTLCTAGQVGCREYRDSQNTAYYFREPGETTCEYRNGYFGFDWYKQRVKRCTVSSDSQTIEHTVANICSADSDCAARSLGSCILDNWDELCPNDGDIAPKTIGFGGAGNRIEQPSSDTSGNWVGLCPAAASGCTEIIDPVSQPSPNLLSSRSVNQDQTVRIKQNTLYVGSKGLDISDNRSGIHTTIYNLNTSNELVQGKPPNSTNSWLIFSNTLSDIIVNPRNASNYFRQAIVNYQLAQNLDASSCNGQFDYSNGCILFNQRSVSGGTLNSITMRALTYDADTIYTNSANNTLDTTATQQLPVCNGASCNPNANIVLKSQHDRVCSEWLACRSYALVNDDTRQNQKICYDIGACDGLDEGNQCKSWVAPEKKNQTVKLDDTAWPSTTPPTPDSRLDVKLISNTTGYSQVGFWNNNSLTEGSFTLGSMEQTGDLTIVPNGNFEITNTAGVPSGWMLRNNDASARAVSQSVQDNMVSVVGTPQAAQRLSISYPVEGRNLLSLGVAFQLHSQVPLEVSPDNPNYTITARVNTLSLTSGSAKIIVQGIVDNGDEPLTSGNTLATLDQAAGIGWSSKFSRFDTGLNNNSYKKIKIIIKTEGQATGNMYVDDIQIRPTLQTRLVTADKAGSTSAGDYWYAQQSCRLYPQSDSLSCDSIDDSGIRQKGWYGYCLEYDRSPGNPNACLLWWPVSQVRGDGVDEQVAAYTGKYPLYYCTELRSLVKVEYRRVEYIGNSCDFIPEPPPPGYRRTSEYHNTHCNDGTFGIGQSQRNHYYNVPEGILFKPDGTYSHPSDELAGRDSGEDGWYAYIGNTSITGLMYYNPEDDKLYDFEKYCATLVQTIDPVGQNKVWTSRVKEGSAYKLSCTDALTNNLNPQCAYQDDLAPFGSLAYPAPVDNPMQWTGKVADKNMPIIAEEPNGQVRFRYSFPFGSGNETTTLGQQLKGIFAKSFGAWEWRWPSPNDPLDKGGYRTVPNFNNWNPPAEECSGGRTHALGIDGTNTYYCAIRPSVNNITVNGQLNGDVDLTTANPLAHLTFTSQVDSDQLPLTEIRVEWGDGYTTSVSGAELRGRPSPDNPHSYYHVYDYWYALEKDNQFSSITCNGGQCDIRLSVWIKDNWGWYSVVSRFGGTIVVKP